jgi:hypothetical protein
MLSLRKLLFATILLCAPILAASSGTKGHEFE